MKPAFALIPTIGLLGSSVIATMSPGNLQDTGNSLARQAFDIKDLVLTINVTNNAGPMQDVFEEMDDLYETVLANIQLVIGSAALTEESQDVQLVYEAYSYLVQGMFELMDALGGSATNFISMDKQNEFRVPATIREVGGVVDAWMFNMIGLFPSNSSYADEAANQKNQVDSHFRRSIAAYHLATAKTGSPYGNITDVASTDALSMSNTTNAVTQALETPDNHEIPKSVGSSTSIGDLENTSGSQNIDLSENAAAAKNETPGNSESSGIFTGDFESSGTSTSTTFESVSNANQSGSNKTPTTSSCVEKETITLSRA